VITKLVTISLDVFFRYELGKGKEKEKAHNIYILYRHAYILEAFRYRHGALSWCPI